MDKHYHHQKSEQAIRKLWQDQNIFKFDEKDTKRPIFSIDTPPPYVNADHLHAGHIMSYAQAEFIARYKRMQGFNVFYPMGFDDNGLPTERFVEKKHNIDKSKVTRSEFIKLCLKETKKGALVYQQLWDQLGVSVDWGKTYSTIDNHSQKIAQWSFIDLYQKGLAYRAEKPIMWCTTCQTAISQADLEDQEEEALLNYLEFRSQDDKPLLIATTRPEYLKACVAMFYHPDDQRYVDLKDKTAIVPLFDHQVPILPDQDVDPDFGTGLMMRCTWGDAQDVRKWEEHKLETRPFIKTGQVIDIKKLRKDTITGLKKSKHLKKQDQLTHTLNVHERCGTPVEYVQSKQWFINLLDHKQALTQQGQKIKWHPEFMKKRYLDWVEGLSWDWCISRQRYYGVPFPLWYCDPCQEIILAKESDLPVDPSDKKKTCPKCNQPAQAETDVMDTWMTSSLTPIIGTRLSNREADLYPMTLRPQAFEIIRTWLFYTVTKSYFHHKKLPFREAMISGHGLDKQGRKISKRLGNYDNPDKIIAEYGADAIRYWATGARLGHDLRYTTLEVEKGKRTVTKLWNVARFASLHLKKVEPDPDLKPTNPVDQWLLYELNQTIATTTKAFDSYGYARARQTIDQFFWSTLADNYLEFSKYRLYEKNDPSAKQTLYLALSNLIKLYAPILPFVTETIYQQLFKQHQTTASLHTSRWPQIDERQAPSGIEQFLDSIEAVRKYKSSQGLSMNVELDQYKLADKLTPALTQELKQIMKIKKVCL